MDMNLVVTENPLPFESDYLDRIGKLPDEILASILSYLPTKEAVATTILSKGWEHLWTLTSQIDFSDKLLLHCENDFIIKFNSFKEHVERVIFCHNRSNIRKCHFNLFTKQVAPYIYAWICAVITWDVHELLLSFTPGIYPLEYHQLPLRTFSCNTLVVLEINGPFVLEVPAYVCFPCLKRLDLKCCLFLDDVSMDRLFSGCPILEGLGILRVIDYVQIMNISIPSLKTLLVGGLGLRDSHTEIDAPCLESLTVVDYTTTSYSVNSTSSLRYASLCNAFDFTLLNGISQVFRFNSERFS